jgi:hypothetical protein
MDEDFILISEKRLFAAPSRAMKCRQMLWVKAKLAEGEPVVLADIVRDHKEEFSKSEIYHAAHSLVNHGLLTRDDTSWGVLVKGKEKTRYRCAVRFIAPFTHGSRVW